MKKGPELIQEVKRLEAENKTQVKVIKDQAQIIKDLEKNKNFEKKLTELNAIIESQNEKIINYQDEIDFLNSVIEKEKQKKYQEPDQDHIKKLKEQNQELKNQVNYLLEFKNILDDIDRYLSGVYSVSNHRYGAFRCLTDTCKHLVKKYMEENELNKSLYKQNCNLEKQLDFYKTTTQKLSSYNGVFDEKN